ncbi:MAG: hypothetical protein Q9198_004386 [Flavoplaca austrocitrina]
MKTKKILPVAAAAVMINHKANCPQPVDQKFPIDADIAKGSANPNETLYGPLKVIELPAEGHPTQFVPYPDIDPEIRKNITNGGLAITCTITAAACNTEGDTLWGCIDNPEICKNMPSTQMCEAQPWYQDPQLSNNMAAAVVYDFRTLDFNEDADVTFWAQRVGFGEETEHVIGPGNYTQKFEMATAAEGSSSKNVVGAGVAAAAVAARFAFLMRP